MIQVNHRDKTFYYTLNVKNGKSGFLYFGWWKCHTKRRMIFLSHLSKDARCKIN